MSDSQVVKNFMNAIRRRCKNCGHPVRTNREMGDFRELEKYHAYHYVDGYGTNECYYCECKLPEITQKEDHNLEEEESLLEE